MTRDLWKPVPVKAVSREFMKSGNCLSVDPDLMFPERGDRLEPPKAVCRGCTVQAECLEYALSPPVERFGIWGGLTEQERGRVRRRRSLAVKVA